MSAEALALLMVLGTLTLSAVFGIAFAQYIQIDRRSKSDLLLQALLGGVTVTIVMFEFFSVIIPNLF